MKNFQIRLADDVYDAIKEIADELDTSIADVIRESLESYVISAHYAREGRQLFWEDPGKRERTEVVIRGLTMRSLRSRKLETPAIAGGSRSRRT